MCVHACVYTCIKGDLRKLKTGPHFKRQHTHSSLNIVRYYWFLYGAFTPIIFKSLWNEKLFSRLCKKKLGHQLSQETRKLHSTLPEKWTLAMVAQNFWVWSTTVWFNLKPSFCLYLVMCNFRKKNWTKIF